MIFQLVVGVLVLLVCVEDVVSEEMFGLRIFPGSAFDDNGQPISLRMGYEGFMMNQLPPPSTQLVRVVFTSGESIQNENEIVKESTNEVAGNTEDELLFEALEELVEVNNIMNIFQSIFAQEAQEKIEVEPEEEFLPEFSFGLRGFRPRHERHERGICLHSCRGVIDSECQAEISRDAPRNEMYKCLQKAGENPKVQIPFECQNTIDEINKRFSQVDSENEHPHIKASRFHHRPMPILKASPELYEQRESKHHGHPHMGHNMRHHRGHHPHMGRDEELYVTPTEETATKETLLQELRAHHLLSENEEFYLQVSIIGVLSLIWIIAIVKLVVRLCSSKEEEVPDYTEVGYVAMSESEK